MSDHTPPTLYYWTSEAFANYGLGHIAVMANTVEEARAKADQFSADALFDPVTGVAWYMYSQVPGAMYASDWDEMAALYDVLLEDLAKEPKIMGAGIIFLEGGE